jgi:hypothetical protein
MLGMSRPLCKQLSVLLISIMPFVSAAFAWEAGVDGYVEAKASTSNTEKSWIEGGSGALGVGDGLFTEARLGFNLRATDRLSGRLEILARSQSADDLGRRAGLLQAFVDYGDLDLDAFRLRAGQSFSGSSVENVESFWQTPFGISFSTLNSWIGEEFRPIGLDLTHRFTIEQTSLDLGGQIFVGNDTGPAMLAWRGFANHQRLSVLGETLPILPLRSLSGPFSAQRDQGTQSFGLDLDGRPGYLLHARIKPATNGNLKLLLVDNRGDRLLHDGDEYAWRTRFGVLSGSYQPTSAWTILGEWMHGNTRMGFPPGGFVDFDFNASYLTLSYSDEAWTHALRLESFHINEQDRSPAERNTQNGNAASFSSLLNQGDWRIGAEVQLADFERPGNKETTTPTNTQQGGWQVQLLLRRYFE